jgi:hypothetical protein
MWKQVFVVALGIWLAISGLAWPHTVIQSWNAIVVGALIALFGILSMGYAWAYRVGIGLAAWLFLSLFVFGRVSPATFWNNVFVAFLVFLASVVDTPHTFQARGTKGMAGNDSPVQ